MTIFNKVVKVTKDVWCQPQQDPIGFINLPSNLSVPGESPLATCPLPWDLPAAEIKELC